MKIRLRTQLFLALIALSSIFVLVFFNYTSNQQYKLFHREFVNKNQSVVQTVKIGLEIGLQNENLAAIKSIFDWIKEQEDFYWIGITDSSGEIFANFPPEIKNNFLTEDYNELDRPFIKNKISWSSPMDHGEIIIMFSTERYQIQSQKLFRDIGLFSGGILLFAALLSMILSYFIASPLSHLEKIIHQITEGHHHHRVSNVGGGQEIYGLTNSFNIMMDEINTAHEKIKEERNKSESLLLNILPKSIAERLKNGEKVISDQLDHVSVMFADLVGFTTLASGMDAYQLVDILNQIFSRFDTLCDQLGTEKIKTIGDSYMAISPLNASPVEGADKIVELAQGLLRELDEVNRLNHLDLKLRIGIHTGKAVAGVIGKRKFSFDLWGDTINISSRLESHGEAGKIQISEKTWSLISRPDFFVEKGEIELKGKGKFKAYISLT